MEGWQGNEAKYNKPAETSDVVANCGPEMDKKKTHDLKHAKPTGIIFTRNRDKMNWISEMHAGCKLMHVGCIRMQWYMAYTENIRRMIANKEGRSGGIHEITPIWRSVRALIIIISKHAWYANNNPATLPPFIP